jgi:hypothetical protein
MIRDWRKLHNLYSSPSRMTKLWKMMGRACSTHEDENTQDICGKDERKETTRKA